MDELVAGEVEGVEAGEPGQQLGGDVVQGVVGEAEESQVGQHTVVFASPSGNGRSYFISFFIRDHVSLIINDKLTRIVW